MIIRETKMVECWCATCHKGQMGQIWQKSFDEKKEINEYIGQQFTCEHCGAINTLEDVLTIFPLDFISFSSSEKKYVSNEELRKFIADGKDYPQPPDYKKKE